MNLYKEAQEMVSDVGLIFALKRVFFMGNFFGGFLTFDFIIGWVKSLIVWSPSLAFA